ncbi:MAG: hypothetical protein KA100_07200 [Rickettsiales bacterium]|nr:hypothetical protein [Rickettsiales bacterium]
MKPRIDQVALLSAALTQQAAGAPYSYPDGPGRIIISYESPLIKILEQISQLEEIDPKISPLIENVIRATDGDYKFPETLNLICTKLGEAQPDYEIILQNLQPHPEGYDSRIDWLIDKVEKISSVEKAEKLIEYLSNYHYRGQEGIATVINKSTGKINGLERFLDRVHDDKALVAILSGMDGLVSDEGVAKNILHSAVWKNNSELVALLASKSSVTIDYDSGVIPAIDHGNLEVLNELLTRGANPNLIGKNSEGNSGHALVQVSYSDCKSEIKPALFDTLLAYGAKLSLLESRDQLWITRMLQEKSNYEEIEKALRDGYEESEKYLPKIFQPILQLAFEKDDPKLIKMLSDRGLGFNSKMPYSWFGYTNSGESETYPLVLAIKGKPKISALLAKNKISVGDHPIIAEAVLANNNLALKALCENGYNLNQTRKKTRENDFHAEKHPLILALFNKNAEAVKILMQHMTAEELSSPDIKILPNLIDSGLEKTAKEQLFLFAVKSRGANPLITDRTGKNALHHAAQMGDKEFFDSLIARGLSPDSLYDKRGNNAYYQALYHRNDEALEVPDDYFPFDLDVFDDLLEFVKSKTNAGVNDLHYAELHGEYAAKFSCLFDDVEQLQSYITRHLHNPQFGYHFHDLTLFTIPQEKNWNKEAWRNLAMEHGPELTKYLFLAKRIEAKLGRPPQNFEEIKLQAKNIKYPRASEFPEMAEVFSDNTIPEHVFNRVLESYRTKPADHIPEILIEGSSFGDDFGADRFYMKKLAPTDLRGFILGNKTACCQYVGAEGNDCAEHGMTSPFGGFYVVFKREKEGRVDNLKNWLEKLETSESEVEFLKSFSDKAARTKYQKTIEEIKKELSTSTIFQPPFEQIKQVLRKDFLKELEGEIVAQSWVWISKNGNLVLDSWERLREEDDVLLKPFLHKLSEKILTENEGIKKILIGSGGYTPENFALSKVESPEMPMDYEAYRDSREQFLIAEKEATKPIKFNDAIFIGEERMRELKNNFDEKLSPKNFAELRSVQQLVKERHQEKLKSGNEGGR